MKLITSLLFIGIILFPSCNGSKKMTAVEYNDSIIEEQSKVIKLTIELVKNMDIDLVACEKNRVDIVKQCDSSLVILKQLEPFNGNLQFKSSAVKLFEYYKKVYSTDYKTLLEILNKGEDLTEEDVDQISLIADKVEKEEGRIEDIFIEAQKEFAKQNNIRIEENELQKEIDAL